MLYMTPALNVCTTRLQTPAPQNASEIEESFSQIEEKPAKPANTDKPKKIEDKSENSKTEDKA